MGERGLSDEPPAPGSDEAATDDDIAAMCVLVDEATEAGALGFATSRRCSWKAASTPVRSPRDAAQLLTRDRAARPDL